MGVGPLPPADALPPADVPPPADAPPPADVLPLVPLGGTGLGVTRLGLGLAALGRPAYITLGRHRDLGDERPVEAMRARCWRMLDAAVAAGIRYVDAARSYGRAEEFLGQWLDRRPSAGGGPTVGSKWGYRYTGDWRMDAPVQEVKELSAQMLGRQWAETRGLLGARVRLYQVHSATIESGVLEDRAVLEGLQALRGEGVVVGLSVSGPRSPEVIRRALAVDLDGANPFRSVQATWNLFEPSAGAALAEAHREGWGVLVKEALANGRLAWPPGDGDRTALGAVARRRGVPVDQVAMAAALAQPWADVVLSGAVTEAQLAANRAAVSVRLTPDELAELAPLAETPADYWRRRAALPWA